MCSTMQKGVFRCQELEPLLRDVGRAGFLLVETCLLSYASPSHTMGRLRIKGAKQCCRKSYQGTEVLACGETTSCASSTMLVGLSVVPAAAKILQLSSAVACHTQQYTSVPVHATGAHNEVFGASVA